MSTRRAFGTIVKRDDRPVFYVKFTWRRRTYKRAAGPTKRSAEKKLARTFSLLESGWTIEETLAEIFGDVYGPLLTFRAAMKDYLEYAKARKKESTYERDVLRLRRTCRASWTKKPLSDIQSRDIQRWITELHGSGLAGSTLNRYRAICSAVYKWAIRMGYVEENPVKRVEAFPEVGRERETYMTAAEARALIDTAEPLFRPILMTAICTGARRSEIMSLRWADLAFDRMEVVVQGAYSKTKKVRVIPMVEELQEELLSVRESRKTLRVDGSDPVFCHPDGSPIKPPLASRMMQRAVKRCGEIPMEKKTKVTFHTTRHTFASLAAQSGVSYFELGKLLGHSTPAMTARYAHFYPEKARDAVGVLGKVIFRTKNRSSRKKSGS